MKFTGQELEQLQQALLKAFSLETLKQMLRFKLEKELDAITTANGFNNIVFDLITIADKEDWLIQLIIVAKDYNPNNKALNAVATTLLNKSKTTSTKPNNESLPTAQTYKNQQLPNLDRSTLFKQLKGLVSAQFNELLIEIDPPTGIIPPIPAAQADRVYTLLEWAKSPTGCGLDKVQEALQTILNP